VPGQMKTNQEKISEIVADLKRFIAWKMASGQETIHFQVNVNNGSLSNIVEYKIQYDKKKIKRLTQ
jgi:CHASE3 domain sensor protein